MLFSRKEEEKKNRTAGASSCLLVAVVSVLSFTEASASRSCILLRPPQPHSLLAPQVALLCFFFVKGQIWMKHFTSFTKHGTRHLRRLKYHNYVARPFRPRKGRFKEKWTEWSRPHYYWERLGMNEHQASHNRLCVNKLIQGVPHSQTSFISSEVTKQLAAISFSAEERDAWRGAALPSMDTPAVHLANPGPDRKAYLQFLVDMNLVFLTMERIIDEDVQFGVLRRQGPTQATTKLSSDIEYISSLLGLSAPFKPDQPGLAYSKKLSEIAFESRPRFLAHMYVFYSEWSFSCKQILTSLSAYLSIVRNLKSQWRTTDLLVLRNAIDELASSWSRVEKNAFLNELPSAIEGPMELTHHLLGYRNAVSKEVDENYEKEVDPLKDIPGIPGPTPVETGAKDPRAPKHFLAVQQPRFPGYLPSSE